MRTITPLELVRRHELAILDVRPRDERLGGVGFVPGSIAVLNEPRAIAAALDDTGGEHGAVLVCLSGNRCRDAFAAIPGGVQSRLWVLEGGVLAWRAEGLPVCGVELAEHHADPVLGGRSLAELPRAMAACFVAEIVEVAGDEVDPMQLLEACFARAGARFDAPLADDLIRVLDHAAAASRRVGTEASRVAANVDRFLAVLQRHGDRAG
ncbi:MAG: hypothetical protein IPK74_17670 [Deltaproteobacteria bacterium]|nr:hypothetical protein [Deltaproteobacteria bacterium]